MKKETVLVSGGAGFIGGHLCEKLLENNYRVVILDNLSHQIHGQNAKLPTYLAGKVEFIQADISDRKNLETAVSAADKIVHLVAETGMGQSMYEPARYFHVTVTGTALLWDVVAQNRERIQKVVLSSSGRVYGEGRYHCKQCGEVYPTGRSEARLAQKQWDPVCQKCYGEICSVPTTEESKVNPTSIYALAKKTQEEISLMMAKALRIPVSIVRYQNVYGPRQSLNNPYTGILSIFSSRLKAGKPVDVYEDGLESRDFVYVLDAVQGTMLALEKPEANYQIFNIASGTRKTISEIAEILTSRVNPSLPPRVTGQYRVGDVRHSLAEISKANKILGYKPEYDLGTGIEQFLEWANQVKSIDSSDQAEAQLHRAGMLK